MKPLTFAPYLPNFAIFPSLIPYLSSLIFHLYSYLIDLAGWICEIK